MINHDAVLMLRWVCHCLKVWLFALLMYFKCHH